MTNETTTEERLREVALSGDTPDEDVQQLAVETINATADDSGQASPNGDTPELAVPDPDEVERSAEGEQPDADEHGDQDDEPAIAKVRKEAASYRRKLREAEAERDALRTRAEALERKEVERQVTDGVQALADGSDLWAAGIALDDLRAEGGSLDPEKVTAAKEQVLEARPHWRRPIGSFDEGARQSVSPSRPDFAKALRDAAGG